MTRVPLDVRLIRLARLVVLAASIGVTSPSRTNALGEHTENFTTTTYKDVANTTVTWDTVSARLTSSLFQPSLAGGFDTPGSALGLARVGTLAYVADGTSGLEIYDVRDPAIITLVGSLPLPGTAYDVVVRGTVAYVADGTSGLKVVNVVNPASPTLLATYSAGINVRGLALAGNTAILACDTGGLRFLSVSNPAAPTLLGTAPLSGNSSSVAVSGLTAYAATGTAGVAIVSFSNPTSPTTLGTYNTPGNAVGIAVAGFRVYVADGASGVEILDATNSSAVALLGTFATAGAANAVTVNGTVLYAAADVAGLQVVNASNPASPVLLNACDTPGNANAVIPINDLAFVADKTSGLRIVRIGTLQRPRLGAPFVAVAGSQPQAVTSVGHLVYTAGWQEMLVVDVSNHSGPTQVGFYRYEGQGFMDVQVSGPRAYVALLNGGLQIINVTDPANPVLWGSLPGFSGYALAVSGAVAYVASLSGGLKIINASNPASPTLITTFATPFATAVKIVGTVAYVADQTAGLQIINVANTSAPTLITTVPLPTYPIDVVVSGSLAFVGTANSGIQIVDISNPATAHIIGSYGVPFSSYNHMSVSGSLLYAISGNLDVIDVSDPTAPVRVWGDRYGEPSLSLAGIALCGSLVYACDSEVRGFQTLEVVQQRFDTTAAVGQSLAVNHGQWFDQMRLTSLMTVDSVAWEFSSDGGSDWRPMVQSPYYFSWIGPSRDLRWRGTLLARPPSVTAPAPEASSITVTWDNVFARIDSIWDVPNDQGGKLRLRFERSNFEPHWYDPEFQVTAYEVYHRIDEPGLIARILSEGSRPDPSSLGPGVPAVAASSLHRWRDRTFVQGGPGSGPPRQSSDHRAAPFAAEGFGNFPPGLWEAIQWLPAFSLDTYNVLLPTTIDSTEDTHGWSVYFVAALTPSPLIWFPSPPESAQSIDNLAPNVPTGLVSSLQPGGIALHWNPSGAADFRYFKVYRDSDPAFTPGPASLVHSTIGTAWVDSSLIGGTVYYKLTALDFAGNESSPASTVLVAGTEGTVAPLRFALRSPMPNPFHGVTAIAFDVPASGGRVEIGIYDIGGRRVRSLMEGNKTAGEWRVLWDGGDGNGRAVRPGVYLCRMRAEQFSDVVKITLSR